MSGLHKYTVIPTEHEALLAQMVLAWKGQSETAFVCVSGLHSATEASEMGEVVYTTVPDQLCNLIPSVAFSDDGFGIILKSELEYFLIEGELPEAVRTLAESLVPPCVFLDSLQDFKIWRAEQTW